MPRHAPRHRSGGVSAWRIAGTLAGIVAAVLALVVVLLALTAVAAFTVLSAGLPDPRQLSKLTFDQPTVVYDRTGKIELGRFERVQRRVVTFDQVPRLVLDATVVAEDRTFWQNDGFDPQAILSAVAESLQGQGDRGASTITQQLVRARLLPPDVVAGDRYIRKAKELIQASRVTQAYPGEAGKEQIITAYLNQIFYGHDAYGIAAAANVYFGLTDLSKLTPAQAALLAALPKSPTTYDPYTLARPDAKGRLVVPPDAPIVVRRNYILQNLDQGRWTHLSPAQIAAAIAQPVVLAGDRPLAYRAPHFMWQVQGQLAQILGGNDAVETGGYRVVTTLDWTGQQLAEKWLTAAVIAPNLPAAASARMLRSLGIGAADRAWIANLRGKDVHNAALVAIDYRTGDVLAYVGSAGYYQDKLAGPKFNPKFDVAGNGFRQPGSAWKPVLYSTAFDRRVLTPGSLLLDVTTRFSPGWTPHDADKLDRGPVRVRQALQYSLNVPAIRTLQRVGNQAVADSAAKMGISFQNGATSYLQAGLAGAIGTVEVRPIDLVGAFGTIANAGVHVPERMILEIDAPDGHVVYRAPAPAKVAKPAISAGSAWLTTNILAGNTDPAQNPIWSSVLELRNGPGGSRRPAAVKTGTTDDTRDLATYGYLAPPADPKAPAIAAGIWMGNSDHSQPRASQAVISLQGPAPLWHAFMRDWSAHLPVAGFPGPPKGVVQATIDRWSGGAPGPWTRGTVREWFLDGTQPGAAHAVDRPGLLYSQACGGWRVDPVKAELGPTSWDADVADWTARARSGPGRTGPLDSTTAYFWGQSSWGGPIIGSCAPPPGRGDGHGRGGGGGGHGHGHGGGGGDGGGGGGG